MTMTDDKSVRRKLVNQGVATLTDAELISIIIREGTPSFSAVELADNLISHTYGGLPALARADIRQLRMTAGLGTQRAAVLAAALELARRLGVGEADVPTQISTNEDVVKIFRPRIAGLPHEEFWVLYLSVANTVIGETKVSQGGVSSTVVDHRLIVKRAVELLASGIILVHNHPSGVAQPSGDDLTLTRKIVEAASLFDIAVLDHLIVTTRECFSFRHAGHIK